MSSDQNKLIGAIRELVQRENNSPSDSDLDAFVKLLQTDKHGEAILSSLLEAQKVSSTSKEFDYEDDDWEHQFRCKTPAVARFFATWTIGLLEVIAPEIKKEAKAKVTVWPAGVIPLVTTRYAESSSSLKFLFRDSADSCSGTLYYNAVEELNGPCDVTVNGSVR
jgi:hypothetical protein